MSGASYFIIARRRDDERLGAQKPAAVVIREFLEAAISQHSPPDRA
jgi:hypothetical protein